MIRTANNSKSLFHEKMQTESDLISTLFSITCHHMKNLRLFALAILCLTCCGCITGTVAEFCDNCYEKSRIIEKITPLLIGLNIKYRSHYGGLRITGIPQFED